MQINYAFRYYIDEPGDDGVSLDHWERKENDGSVKGGYGYRDPFGIARTVYYKVEEDKGFEAIIKVVSPGGLFHFHQQQQFSSQHRNQNQNQRQHHPQQPKVPYQHAKPINFL
jgi:hypothetical protein